MDKTKVKKWVYISCITAVVLIWLLYLTALMVFEDGRPGICEFLNNILSSMNLNLRVSVDNISSIFGFTICFGLGMVYPESLRVWREKNISKNWNSKKCEIWLWSTGLFFSIISAHSETFFIVNFIINLIVYALGVLIYRLLHSENKEKNSKDIKDELAVNKLKVKNWVYILCIAAVVLIWLLYETIGYSEIRNFLNNLLSSMNLSFKVSLDDVEHIFNFIIGFGFGLIFPAALREQRENDISKKWWTSKKWNLIWLCLFGLILSIPALSSGTFLLFVINFIVYALGILVYWLLHFEKKEKNIDSKKV